MAPPDPVRQLPFPAAPGGTHTIPAMRDQAQLGFATEVSDLARDRFDRLTRSVDRTPNVLRYAIAALIGALGPLLLGAAPIVDLPHGIAVVYPLVATTGAIGGLAAGVLSGLAAGLVAAFVWPLLPPVLALVITSLALVGGIAGLLANFLRSSRDAVEEQRVASNAYAATLHLRLTLAEQEIDRLRIKNQS